MVKKTQSLNKKQDKLHPISMHQDRCGRGVNAWAPLASRAPYTEGPLWDQLQTGKTRSQQIKVLHLIMPYSKGGTEN